MTDFLELAALQELQDNFAALTRLHARICDAHGQPLTQPTNLDRRARSDAVLDHLLAADTGASGPLVAPVVVDGQRVGSVVLDYHPALSPLPHDRQRLAELFGRRGVPPDKLDALLDAAEDTFAPRPAAAVQLLFVMAEYLAALGALTRQLRERIEELSVLNQLSGLLAGSRDLQHLLDTAARSAVEALGVRGASIRMLDDTQRELKVHAVYGLSQHYLDKGPVLLARSSIAKAALAGEVVYVEDIAADPRVIYAQDAIREGLVSSLAAGMVYRGQPIGTIQVYTGQRHRFSRYDVSLLQSIAQLTATAIENARLSLLREESERVQRQLKLAAEVQGRMLPAAMPLLPPFDIAARYVPSYELGGDFYDFIDLKGHLGLAIGDVAGKGIAAALLMASVRAGLRAFAQDVYDLDEIMSRLNVAMCQDTQAHEFATLFYGVLDPQGQRLTYCNAGHEPPLLLRDGALTRLEAGGMVVGVDPQQPYERSVVALRSGDVILLATDGLMDARSFAGERFGRPRIITALRSAAAGSAQDIANHVLWEMRRFTGLNRNVDDTTLVVVKVG